jgi:hypothetical protein
VSKRAEKTVRVKIYHEQSIQMLLASCAHAGALGSHTEIVSRQYDGTMAYNFLAYYVPAWRVEYKEVMRTDEVLPQAINRTRAKLYLQFQREFVAAMRAGPVAVEAYVERLEFYREAYLGMAQRRYDDVRSHNAKLDAEMKDSIRTWAQVRCVSTVALAGIGAFVGATGTLVAAVGSEGIYFSYKLVNSFETSGASLSNVGAVALWNSAAGQPGDILQEAFNQAINFIASAHFKRYVQPVLNSLGADSKTLLAELNHLGRVYNTFRASNMSGGVRRIEGEMFKKITEIEQKEAAKRTAARTVVGGVAKSLPVIWFANDTFNALVEYRDTMAQ